MSLNLTWPMIITGLMFVPLRSFNCISHWRWMGPSVAVGLMWSVITLNCAAFSRVNALIWGCASVTLPQAFFCNRVVMWLCASIERVTCDIGSSNTVWDWFTTNRMLSHVNVSVHVHLTESVPFSGGAPHWWQKLASWVVIHIVWLPHSIIFLNTP